MKRPMLVSKKNEDRIDDLLDFGHPYAAQKSMFSSYEDLAELANSAERFLDEKGIPKGMIRVGTVLRAVSGAKQRSKKTQKRVATYVRMTRTLAGWLLCAADQVDIDHEGGRVIYEMTGEQIAFMVRLASIRTFVKKNGIDWKNDSTRYGDEVEARLYEMMAARTGKT